MLVFWQSIRNIGRIKNLGGSGFRAYFVSFRSAFLFNCVTRFMQIVFFVTKMFCVLFLGFIVLMHCTDKFNQ